MSPTSSFTGKPTPKTFSDGTTRDTSPKAASVRTSASTIGPATCTAELKMVTNDCTAPPTSVLSEGICVTPTTSTSWG